MRHQRKWCRQAGAVILAAALAMSGAGQMTTVTAEEALEEITEEALTEESTTEESTAEETSTEEIPTEEAPIEEVSTEEITTETETFVEEELIPLAYALEESEEEVNGNVVAISESLDSVTCGENVTLTFHENKDFSDAITGVLVNDDAVDFDKDSNSISISGNYFKQVGVYHIEVLADGYQTSMVYQQVYEDDIWELVFADEFDADSLDENIWSYQNGTGAEYGLNGWGNNEEQYYTSDNLSLKDGTLTIEAKKESRDGKSYTSSRIRSLSDGNEGFSTTYGRIEAKIKMPAGDGIWPAFWMLPSTDTYGTWASNGEIDIMEARGRLTNQVLGTVHYGSTWPNNKSTGVTYELPDNGSITDYHLYALEWDVDSLTWYVDGVAIKTVTDWYSEGYDYPAPFDEPFHIVFDMAIGGTFDGGRTPSDSTFDEPVEMNVDYVRVYRNNTDGYYDREVQKPEQETDETAFANYTELYADENGNFITDTQFSKVESAESFLASDMDDSWERHWYFLLGDYQGSATYTNMEEDGTTYAAVDITNGGNQNYAVQLIQHLPLVKGYTYELSFDAYASKERTMVTKLAGDDDNSWAAYSNIFQATLGTQTQHYSYTFTMDADTDETARLEFNMGLDTGTIYIANVCVRQTDETDNNDTTDTMEEPAVGNIVPAFSEWTHYVGSDWAYVTSNITSQSENDISLTVKADGGWGDTAWGVQLYKAAIPVGEGYPYTVSFIASATQDKSFAFKLEDGNGAEIIYKEYTLVANEEQTITLQLDEMETNAVKAYFALGVFPNEKYIDTEITISDFSIYYKLEDTDNTVDDTDDTTSDVAQSDASASSVASDSAASQSSSQESSSQSSTQTSTTNKTVKVEDKLANVIFDSNVPLAENATDATAQEQYDISLYGSDAILTVSDLKKLQLKSMILNAFLSDKLAVTINSAYIGQVVSELALDMDRNDTIDYGQGFASVTYVPKKSAAIGYPITLHLGIGAEHAGKTAYLFAVDLATGKLTCRQTTTIDSIGNIAYTTEEYSTMVILY